MSDAPAGDDSYSPGGSHRPTDDDPETDTTLTFTAIDTKTVYAITGYFAGNIVIDVGDTYKFDSELTGFTLTSNTVNPITILSGNKRARKGVSPLRRSPPPRFDLPSCGARSPFFCMSFPRKRGRTLARGEAREIFFFNLLLFFQTVI